MSWLFRRVERWRENNITSVYAGEKEKIEVDIWKHFTPMFERIKIVNCEYLDNQGNQIFETTYSYNPRDPEGNGFDHILTSFALTHYHNTTLRQEYCKIDRVPFGKVERVSPELRLAARYLIHLWYLVIIEIVKQNSHYLDLQIISPTNLVNALYMKKKLGSIGIDVSVHRINFIDRDRSDFEVLSPEFVFSKSDDVAIWVNIRDIVEKEEGIRNFLLEYHQRPSFTEKQSTGVYRFRRQNLSPEELISIELGLVSPDDF